MSCNSSHIYPIHILTDPPSVRMISALETELTTGDHFVVSCAVDGNPAPDTYIEKEDSYGSWEIQPVSSTNKQSRNLTKEIVWNFNISIIEGDEKGNYRCFANNSQGDSVSGHDLVLNIKSKLWHYHNMRNSDYIFRNAHNILN